ncbi:hypothetical protein Btru_061510 [Bulinus truncatus]|nr:hypothetical protein Btru_061510 [Bulinus truncatus]
MPPDTHSNSTTPEHRSAATVENVGNADSQTLTICVSLSVVAVIVGVCAILCYREVNRRRKETLVIEEFARRESIKKSIKDKLQQLQQEDETDSYKDHMDSKVPQVKFSEVVQINPALTPYGSSDDLDQAPPPSPQPKRTRKQPQRAHHMYQSYYDNLVRSHQQARKLVVKIQQHQQQIASKESAQTEPLLLPSEQADPESSPISVLISEDTLSHTNKHSSKRYLRDDISQHPLGIPLKTPMRKSWYSYFSSKLLLRTQNSSGSLEENSTDLALVNGHKESSKV